MAVFVQTQNNNIVQAIEIADSDCGGGVFPLSEPIGQDFIAEIGIDGYWLQTSPIGEYRSVYAGIGYTYDPDLDIFVMPITEEVTQ
jgi:hypothetical protein